jgi:hypothetical protein
MATTTTNFGWDIPQSTDLVKDGATAIAALGQDIDTALVDLKGGTTGQILAKASNTDLDYTWVAQDDSNAIQNAIVDAKGDLIAATAADTPARLAVGTDGQVLTASSGAATGLTWATPAASFADNPILNSSFQVWQRGTSIAGATAINYTADQWQLFRAGTTITRQVTGDTTNLPNIQYCARVQRNSGTSGTSVVLLSQSLETLNAIPYAGKTVTLSFYARKGANYSGASSGMGATVFTGTGTDQSYIGGFTGVATAFTGSAILTSTWQRFTFTGSIAATATEIAVNFSYEPVGTAGANDYFEVTGVQLEVGSTASAYHSNQPTIQAELAACQRYYFRSTQNANLILGAYGNATSTTVAYVPVPYPVSMRVTPTALDYSSVYLSDTVNAFTGIASVTLGTSTNALGEVAVTINAGSLTQFRTYKLVAFTNGGYVGFSAEL